MMFRKHDLKKDIHFIPASELLDEVRNDLRVYFERSVLDDSHFYPVIRECLAKLGAKVYPVGGAIVWISDYNGNLPKDFHRLIMALGCFQYTIESTPNENPQIYESTESQIKDFLVTKPKETCVDDCDNKFYIIQRFETFDIKYSGFAPLSLSPNSLPYCSNDCWNKQVLGQAQIEIANGKMYTGFEEGSVYINYLQKLETYDEEGTDLLIPDFAQIREWIKMACIKKAFQIMYWNNDADVQQRYHDAKNELTVLESNAKSFVRRSEFSELYDIRKVFFGRYNKFQEVVYGPGQTVLNARMTLRPR